MNVLNANVVFPLFIAALFSNQLNADQDLEKRYLAKIHHELSALAPFLKKASDNARKASRYYFDHEKLSLTLKQIMLEIEKHMNAERRAPYHISNNKLKPNLSDESKKKSVLKLGPPVSAESNGK